MSSSRSRSSSGSKGRNRSRGKGSSKGRVNRPVSSGSKGRKGRRRSMGKGSPKGRTTPRISQNSVGQKRGRKSRGKGGGRGKSYTPGRYRSMDSAKSSESRPSQGGRRMNKSAKNFVDRYNLGRRTGKSKSRPSSRLDSKGSAPKSPPGLFRSFGFPGQSGSIERGPVNDAAKRFIEASRKGRPVMLSSRLNSKGQTSDRIRSDYKSVKSRLDAVNSKSSKSSISAEDMRLYEKYGKMRTKLRQGGQIPAPPAVSQPNWWQRNVVNPVKRGVRENIAEPWKENISDPFKRNVAEPFNRNVAAPINRNIIQPTTAWTNKNIITPSKDQFVYQKSCLNGFLLQLLILREKTLFSHLQKML